MLDINIIINIFINWLMTQTKIPMTHIWVMTHRLGTTVLEELSEQADNQWNV